VLASARKQIRSIDDRLPRWHRAELDDDSPGIRRFGLVAHRLAGRIDQLGDRRRRVDRTRSSRSCATAARTDGALALACGARRQRDQPSHHASVPSSSAIRNSPAASTSSNDASS
jgi:hypothetical protein